MAKAEIAATRTILVILDGNRRRLVENIPGNAKITFGPISPGKGFGDNALRIYTSESNQLAVFVGVKEFRDLTLTVKEQKVSKSSDSVHSSKGHSSSDSTYPGVGRGSCLLVIV